MASGDSFLPRIQSVFYAVFDIEKGPMIVYQVPEGLIGVTPAGPSGNTSIPPSPFPSDTDLTLAGPRSASLASKRHNSRSISSPQKTPVDSSQVLFKFDDISNYVIPRSALCGRLVICAIRKHRIIGFPVELRGDYKRNYFRYNLCFVFERSADLSCYEPAVRKVSRVLSCCEEESRFLSSPTTSPRVHAILEQLYEDLNSYSETHIPIDQFNSIELKIFPFYPNPPTVKDWMVPLALINLKSRIEANWDLTLVKVCQFIDGTNHVSRIANLADCDLELTRQAISHLLYYQVIMTIDIFQYSNVYTLSKGIQWLADEAHVREQCGPYVCKPGCEVPHWPTLLHLYSRLKPGTTVLEWMEEHEVHKLGLDVRRFMSFGVIKGFLRRVHRWPVLLREHHTQFQPPEAPLPRRRAESLTIPVSPTAPVEIPLSQNDTRTPRGRFPRGPPFLASVDTESAGALIPKDITISPQISRRTSSAGPSSVQSRSDGIHSNMSASSTVRSESQERLLGDLETRRQSLTSPAASSATFSSLSMYNFQAGPKPFNTTASRAKLSRSPSQQTINLTQVPGLVPAYPPDLLPLLDGEHHTDELATRFETGWPLIEQWLVAAGGGKGDGDFGRITIIYR